MSSVPIPARLIHLSDLGRCSKGSKVRFLGCVAAYDIDSGYVYLQPPVSKPRSNQKDPIPLDELETEIETETDPQLVVAELETSLIRGDLKESDTAIGTWLNVVGYVQSTIRYKGSLSKTRIQALTVWDAGPLDAGAYHKALESKLGLSGDTAS